MEVEVSDSDSDIESMMEVDIDIQQIDLQNEKEANNWEEGGLHPLLIDNVLDVLMAKLTPKILLDVRQVCKLWDMKASEQIHHLKKTWPISFRSKNEIDDFFRVFNTPDPDLIFDRLAIHDCDNFNYISIAEPRFPELIQNIKEFKFVMSSAPLNYTNFIDTLRNISGSVQVIKIKYEDNEIVNHCLRQFVGQSWPQDIQFPELRELHLDVVPPQDPTWPVPPNDEENPEQNFQTVEYFTMFVQNAPKLTKLKLYTNNCPVLGQLLLMTPRKQLVKRLDTLDIHFKHEIKRLWANYLLRLVVKQDIRLKHFGLTCFYSFNQDPDPNANPLGNEFMKIKQFLQNQSESLESLKLSIWQVGAYVRTGIRVPPLPKIKKLTFTSKAGLRHLKNYPNVPEDLTRPRSGLCKIPIKDHFPALTHLRFVGKKYFLRNIIETGELASETVTQLEIKESVYGVQEEIIPLAVWFPNLKSLLINKCHILSAIPKEVAQWPPNLAEIEIILTADKFNKFDFNHFSNVANLSQLKLGEWLFYGAERKFSIPNMESISQFNNLTQLSMKTFIITRSKLKYLKQLFPEKLDVDYTIRRNICYL